MASSRLGTCIGFALWAICGAGCVLGDAEPLPEDVSSTSSELDGTPITELTLQNGWTNTPYWGTRNAGVTLVSGIVHFKGAIGNGSSPLAFTLPSAFRPAANVYVPVDLCVATRGACSSSPAAT
jgi:hypothetical protein